MSISTDPADTDALCIAYDATYGVEYPTISGAEGGGDAINSTYGTSAYPTYILIAPNHSIVEQDMWPISSLTSFVNYMSPHGLVQTECSSVNIEEVESGSNLFGNVNIYPNPVFDDLNVAINLEQQQDVSVEAFDVVGKKVYSIDYGLLPTGENKLKIETSQFSSGIYTLSVRIGDELVTRKISVSK